MTNTITVPPYAEIFADLGPRDHDATWLALSDLKAMIRTRHPEDALAIIHAAGFTYFGPGDVDASSIFLAEVGNDEGLPTFVQVVLRTIGCDECAHDHLEIIAMGVLELGL